MSSNVQSIICCLGDPVAGNPTQFLMQRAAAALSLDWMFVTAEVSESKIIEAFQGIRALRFSGVAFLPPHRSVGCALVDSMTEAATRSGHVRVARRDGDLWLGDDTLGAAIVELIRSLQGRSADPLNHETSDAILVFGSAYLPHLIRLASPASWADRLFEWGESIPGGDAATSPLPTLSIDPSDSQTLVDSQSIGSRGSASIPKISFDDVASNEQIIDTLVIDSTAGCLSARQFAKLKWSDNPSIIFVEPNSRWELALKAHNISNLRILRTLDVAAAKATVNFQFWTGHSIDLLVMRESLDEYCQW